ncbi:hypothetical protein BDF21DRAFT_402932 [Thamnidium elegans]|nr:hypothetical protein BDF21DRAFT_402932 [Thamnidium elegans]
MEDVEISFTRKPKKKTKTFYVQELFTRIRSTFTYIHPQKKQLKIMKRRIENINNYRIVDVLLEDIIKLPEKYQQYITRKILYIRLLSQVENDGGNSNVVESLQSMIVGLQKRPSVGNVYVSVSCNSNTPMHRRDLKKSNVMNDARELNKDLAKVDKAFLVIIDSASLTTNMNDLELFIRLFGCLQNYRILFIF